MSSFFTGQQLEWQPNIQEDVVMIDPESVVWGALVGPFEKLLPLREQYVKARDSGDRVAAQEYLRNMALMANVLRIACQEASPEDVVEAYLTALTNFPPLPENGTTPARVGRPLPEDDELSHSVRWG